MQTGWHIRKQNLLFFLSLFFAIPISGLIFHYCFAKAIEFSLVPINVCFGISHKFTPLHHGFVVGDGLSFVWILTNTFS